jgi:hypothetical protein
MIARELKPLEPELAGPPRIAPFVSLTNTPSGLVLRQEAVQAQRHLRAVRSAAGVALVSDAGVDPAPAALTDAASVRDWLDLGGNSYTLIRVEAGLRWGDLAELTQPFVERSIPASLVLSP